MKKSFTLLLLLSGIAIGITSCKKSNKSSTNKSFLLKFVELDTTQQAPNDTLEIDNYTYDNLGRWISEEYLPADDNGYADIVNGTDRNIITNSYSGNKEVPNLIVTSEYTQDTLYDTYYDYNVSFSTSGQLLKDSDVDVAPGSSNDTLIYTYSYSGSTVTESGVDLSDPLNIQSNTATQTKVNGNIVSQIGNPDNDDSFTASYDTNTNPFPDATTTFFPSVDGSDNIDFGQKNNLTEINGEGVHTKYTYTYNANGYPATVVVYDLSSGTPVFVYKGIYIYQ